MTTMKNSLLLAFFLLTIFTVAGSAQTYTTIANGNWNSSSTWLGGSIPATGSDIPATAVINIRHTVAYDTGNPMKNRGEIRIQPVVGTVATLTVPTGINVENLASGEMYIISARFTQCRFVGCNNGEPYSGNNPGAPIQSGTFKNLAGYMEVTASIVEIAQDWTNESGGTRLITDSCVLTGQNFSLSSSGSSDVITRTLISVGWHNSGSFDHSDGSALYDRLRVQIAGPSGNFKLNSGTVNGDIDVIQLRNQIVPFVGTGEISASTSVVTGGINLDAYCVFDPSKYIPNGKFAGPQLTNCSNAAASCLAPTAAAAFVEGRVMTSAGVGIGNAVVQLIGGELNEPIRVLTGPFGYYRFAELPVGHTYLLTVSSKRYQFSNPSRVVSLIDDLSDIDFIADESGKVTVPQRGGR